MADDLRMALTDLMRKAEMTSRIYNLIMFRRARLPKLALALLGFFLFVSISEAVECAPDATTVEETFSSCLVAETVFAGLPGDRGAPVTSSTHAGEDSLCVACSFCMSPCVESSSISGALVAGSWRFVPPAHTMDYESPSFAFLRPPRS